MPTATLEHIFRYPIKGFGPDRLNSVMLETGKLLPFDRAWAIENGRSPFDPKAPAHVKKKHFLMLAGQAGIANVAIEFTSKTRRAVFKFSDQEIDISLDHPATHGPLFLALEHLLGDEIRGPLKIIHARLRL